jgi:hypothetical protein
MIIIAANGTIGGVANVASKLTITMYGMEYATSTAVETYKVLYQGQLPSGAGTIYTATANGPTMVRSIDIVNTDTVARTFALYTGGTATTNQITPTFTLLAGAQAHYEDQLGWQFLNTSGQLLTAVGGTIIGAMDNWGITGCLAETMDRNMCPEVNSTIPTASGTLWLQAIWLTAGQTVSNISIHSATTAASGPTHWMFGLYSGARALLATSTDQTSTAWAATTLKTLAMTTPYLVPSSGLYYIGFFMAVSTTLVTCKGGTAKTGGQLAGQTPILQGATTDTGLTTALPSNAGSITVSTASLWACVS